MKHEGFTRADGSKHGWDCRCGESGAGFPSQSTAEDSLRVHLALAPNDGGPIERLAAYVALYHPSSYLGRHLQRALNIARGVEPVPTAQELTEQERAEAAPRVAARRPANPDGDSTD